MIFSPLAQRVHEGIPVSDHSVATMIGAPVTSSGVSVTPEIAESIAAWFCAFDIRSNSLKSMPMLPYVRSAGGGREIDYTHPSYRLLNIRPNPLMSHSTFRKLLSDWAQQWGNGIAEIERNGMNEPIALWPIHPSRVKPRVESAEVYYDVTLTDGRKTSLRGFDVFHVYEYSRNGLWGISKVELARETLGIALAKERFEGKFFRRNARPQGYLEWIGIDGKSKKLDSDQIKEARRSWQEQIESESDSGIIILHNGMKFQPSQLSPEDAQFVASVAMSVAQISRFTHVPLSMLADITKANYNSLEQMSLDYNNHAVLPLAKAWEDEADRKLLKQTELEGRTHFHEHLWDALMIVDLKARNEALEVERRNGILDTNEWRRFKNLNPLSAAEGGNERLIPVNYQPLSRVAAQAEAIRNGADPFAGVTGGGRPSNNSDANEARESGSMRRSIAQAFIPALEDDCARMVRKEGAWAERMSKKSLDNAAARSAVSEFYAEHVKTFRAAVGPTFDSIYLALATLELGSDLSPIARQSCESGAMKHCKEASAAHCDESAASIVAALTSGTRFDRNQWEAGRAAAWARSVVTKLEGCEV